METTPAPPVAPPPTSLAARLLNVFAVPGDVFAEVSRSAGSPANWLVPVLLAALVGVGSAFIIFSQPAIIQKIHEQQARMFDDQVKAGKMTPADADKALGMAERFSGPTTMKITGSIGAVCVSFARVFWWALILWLLGLLVLKSKISYLKTVEVAGLATMISVLGGLVTLLLTVNFGKPSSASLALAFGDASPTNKFYPLLAALDFFNLWFVVVLGVGLSRLAAVRFPRAFLLVAGYWLVQQFILISLGALAAGLMGGIK